MKWCLNNTADVQLEHVSEIFCYFSCLFLLYDYNSLTNFCSSSLKTLDTKWINVNAQSEDLKTTKIILKLRESFRENKKANDMKWV